MARVAFFRLARRLVVPERAFSGCSELSHAPISKNRNIPGIPYAHQKRPFVDFPQTGDARIQRDSRFSSLKDSDITSFRNILGENGVIVDADELEVANTDWMHKYRGNSQLLLRPQTSEHVSQVLKYCNSRRLAVVPQGGNTGLVGGSVPVFDEIILSLGSMNKIISFDKVSGILVCEAGCILETMDSYVTNLGFTMPLDLGAKGSCQVGGNVSTNAGGLRLLRYGSLRGSILGLEVVLANGTVVDMLTCLRKDNTGYDLKQLFIGGEGTLGVVTKVSILTPPKLSSVNLAFLACKDFHSCQETFVLARRELGEILSAFEMLDRPALDLVLKHLEGTRDPLPDSSEKFYLLIETTGSQSTHDKEKLDKFLEASIENELVVDGVVAQDASQSAAFWRIREGVSEALLKAGAVYKYDLSFPVNDLYSVVDELRTRLDNGVTVIGYGHLGDGNLHLNVSAPAYDEKLLSQIEPFVYERTASCKGSVSAEHGLGVMKAHAIHYTKSAAAVDLMVELKNLFDPNGILNPYKVLANANAARPEEVSNSSASNLEQ